MIPVAFAGSCGRDSLRSAVSVSIVSRNAGTSWPDVAARPAECRYQCVRDFVLQAMRVLDASRKLDQDEPWETNKAAKPSERWTPCPVAVLRQSLSVGFVNQTALVDDPSFIRPIGTMLRDNLVALLLAATMRARRNHRILGVGALASAASIWAGFPALSSGGRLVVI